MMRTLKFRAWDGAKFGYVVLDPQTINVPTTEWWKRSSYGADFIRFGNLEDWQQFTGLHDKNGKEIYEGDIVKASNDVGDHWLAEVIFLDGGFWVNDDFERNDLGWLVSLGNCEVIGNIYENPELVEKEAA